MTFAMSEFLTVKDISKRFQPDKEVEVLALDAINLVIEQGEFVVISGPSGSGKTTLLNIIGGLDLPTGGEIILDGKHLTDLSEKDLSQIRRDQIGFVFQAYNLLPVLTARENIEYVMKLQGAESEECAARSLEVAEKLGIETLLDKLPHQLSGGQQQRVAVARAVASTPKLVLADEPTANLDAKNAHAILQTMKKLNEELKTTFLFSTHDEKVMRYLNRLVHLDDGRVVQDERVEIQKTVS